MKIRIAIVLSALAVFCLMSACRKEQQAGEVQTGTIAPATPDSAGAGDSDTAMTQTVEIGDERSPNEGGVLTDSTVTETTTSTTQAPPPSTARAKKR